VQLLISEKLNLSPSLEQGHLFADPKAERTAEAFGDAGPKIKSGWGSTVILEMPRGILFGMPIMQ